jgi:glycosyltransferase involved in cell wall biosynthesis
MNIAYISHSTIPSRSANSVHVMKMCQAFSSLGYRTHLYAQVSRKGPDADSDDVFAFYNIVSRFEVSHIPSFGANNGSFLLKPLRILLTPFFLFPKLKRFKADLVYGRDFIGCLFTLLLGYKVIFEIHRPIRPGTFKSFLFRRMMSRKNLLKLVVITDALKSHYTRSFQIHSEKICLAPDAADEPNDFSKSTDWPGRKGALQAGYVGNLFPGKGMEIVGALCGLLPEVDFHIIGGMEEDVAHWEKKIRSHNTFFHGFVSQDRISQYINTLDICLLPNQKKVLAYGHSDNNRINIAKYTSPLKMFEYMAHKKPMIASDLPVLREVLNERNAVLVKHDDIDAWREAILSLKGKGRRTALGEAAFDDFRRNYTWRHRAKKVLEHIALPGSNLNKVNIKPSFKS